VVLCIALLSCMAVWAVLAQHRNVERTRAALQRSYEVQEQLRTVFSLIQDAETGQRGYILTGDPAYLKPYVLASPAIASSVSRLRTLLHGDPRLLEQVDRLDRLVRDKQKEMARTIGIRDDRGDDAAIIAVQEGGGKITMDNIRVSVAALGHAEEQARMSRRAAEEREFRELVVLFLGLFAVISVVLVMSGIIAFNALKRRMASEAALRTQTRRAQGLQRIAEAAGVAHTLHGALASTLAELMRLLKGQQGLALWRTSASDLAAVRKLAQFSQPDGGLEQVESEVQIPEALQGWPAQYPDRGVRVESVAAQGESPGCRQVHIPIAGAAGPSALLMLTLAEDDIPTETAESFAAAAAAQLRHAAERQRIVDTLNDALARSQGIFDSAIDGILTIQRDGMVESINPAALAMFGYDDTDASQAHVPQTRMSQTRMSQTRMSQTRMSQTRMSQMHVSQLLADEFPDSGAVDKSLRLHEGIGCIHESMGLRRDGSRFPVDVALNELALFDKKLLVAMVRDASERKRLERIKNEFIATVSHELRTPLTSISGALRLLETGAAGTLPEKAARLAYIAHTNSQRLVLLVNDILDIEKIEAGLIKFDIRARPLDAIAHLSVEANQGYAQRYGVTLEMQLLHPGLMVLTDADRLNQVLTNLISNAVKFSPEGGIVTLAIQGCDGMARLAVGDQGSGIPAEFQERIYDKFAQADASDQRSKGGTGLGLSITKQLVTQMNGRISFVTGPAGTVFTVEIPLAPQSAHADAAGPQ
jgi:signal transduction histidine kinase/CHASE3 domain sensor protein